MPLILPGVSFIKFMPFVICTHVERKKNKVSLSVSLSCLLPAKPQEMDAL